MAIEKIINLETVLDDKGLKDLEAGLKKVDKEQQNVSNSAQKASASVDDLASNGGAIAILDSLTGGLATTIKDSYEATKLFNFSLKGTKTALIATGIGAFVVALGLVVAYWDEIGELITGANESLQEQIDLNEDLLEVGNSRLASLKLEEKLLINQGKSTEENKKQQKLLLEQLIKTNEAQLLILEAQLATEKSKINELTTWEQTEVAAYRALGYYDKANKLTQEALNGDSEELAMLQEKELQIEKTRQALLNLKIEESTPAIVDTTASESIEQIERGQVETVGGFSEAQLTELEVESEFTIAKNEIRAEAIRQDLANETAASFSKRKLLEQEAQLRYMLQQQSLSDASNTFDQIAQIAGKDSKVGKAMAVASATINGVQAVQNAYMSAQSSPITAFFPAYPVVQAALAGVVAAKNIAAIKSVNPTGAGGSGSIPNASSGGGASAPSFNIVGQGSTNQLAQTIGEQSSEPIQAYVVASQVTSQQNLDNNIVETATLN